jgi:hypothetical protein
VHAAAAVAAELQALRSSRASYQNALLQQQAMRNSLLSSLGDCIEVSNMANSPWFCKLFADLCKVCTSEVLRRAVLSSFPSMVSAVSKHKGQCCAAALKEGCVV